MFSKGKISLIATFHKLKVFLGHRTNRVFPSFAYLSVVKHADRYKMDHPKRGRAYIFNHETFNPHLNLPPRTGTAKDRHDLSERLQELGDGENRLYARDFAYQTERLWSQFTSTACPTLAGKPKFFFLQVILDC